MADIKELYGLYQRAVEKNDEEAVSLLGNEILRMQNYKQPEPPPGVMIHGGNGVSYISDRPDVNVIRPNDPSKMDAELGALAMRGRVGSGSLAAPALQGVSMGWGDEAVSAMGAALQPGEFQPNYDRNQAFMRQELEAARAKNPYSSMGAELAGSILTGVAASPARAMGLTGTTMKGRAASSAIEGALFGGAYGAGQSEGNNRIADGIVGAGAGAALGSVAPMAGDALSKGASKAMGVFGKKPPKISIDQFKASGNAAYDQADKAGVVFTPQAMARLYKDIEQEFVKYGYHPDLQPGARAALSSVHDLLGSNVTLRGLDTVRKIAGGAYVPGNKSNNKLALAVSQKIDDLVASPLNGDILMGDAKAGAKALGEARDFFQRSSKLERVEKLMENAALQAGSSGSGGNIENASRQQLKKLLTNPNLSRGFTPDEKSAIKAAVVGTPGRDALRLVGRLSPQGNGLMMALATGGVVTVPEYAIPFAVAGYGAKKASDALSARSVDNLERLIAAGGMKSAMQAPSSPFQRAVQTPDARDIITRAFLSGAIPMASSPPSRNKR